MQTIEDLAAHHRKQPFALPNPGDTIISADTGVSYTIGSQFAGGGFGKVFHCTDDWDHSLVAKVLNPVGSEEEMSVRAASEVIAANIARSPHIVQVHDAFVFEGAYYIVSELCTLSLHQFMDRPNIKRRFWFRALSKAVLHALHFMHTRGLAHCDVHAGNVLLHCKDDCMIPHDQFAFDFKLGDFGQTRLLEATAPRSTWNETCMPPEVLDESFGPCDARADLYQAGLLFLRFLSDKPLEFDLQDILSARPREMAESLMHPAGEAIALMLRRHPEARPQNALAAWLILKEALHEA